MKKLKPLQGTVYPVSMFDQAGWNTFSELGLTMQFFKQHGRGMATIEQNIKYKKELIAGQNVYVESMIAEVREKVLIIQFTMLYSDSNVTAAECRLVAVHLDALKRKSQAFPDHIFEKAKSIVNIEAG
jgi:acyl-CoA thioester hydrolase